MNALKPERRRMKVTLSEPKQPLRVCCGSYFCMTTEDKTVPLPKMTKYLNAATFGMLLLADAVLPTWATTSNRQEEVFQGVARDERGEIAYTEEHRMIYQDGRPQRNETRYRDAQGQEIAVLNSNFTTHPYVPSYSFEDRRFGRQDGTFVDGAWVKIYGRADQNAPVQQERVRLEENMVTGQGLHLYLRDHMEQLSKSDDIQQVRFLVPLEGRDFMFRIRRLDTASEPGTVGLNIEADSWLLRLVAPKLEVRYDRETRRLLSYRGASNLLNADQDVQNVTITYRYPN
ncbi:hypothetical protein BN874_120006 [Candidatus Contendobacter odensis Run_B_J11]|uniref:DUF3108 domain-containing protein n=1 Tax=Candidatus Contendobacter odensis Run_B_J11 TaxID=1400861 RepID=A0A7U7G880_9GAMM|nr:hypothetical protein BN874_120006 [Candidatus Contendobacter odensis Run_B_J11]